jgi:[pyruvate, water dikinase]-phosphate phosphotransferase / [pyruvate, water dikinase] kinase
MEQHLKSSRTVFFVSDSTGITAHTLGHSLLSQFDHLIFEYRILSNINTVEIAQKAVLEINQCANQLEHRPLIFVTITDAKIRHIISKSHGMVMDLLGTFIEPLELELQMQSSHAVGRSHNTRVLNYNKRINAINFATQHDDGASTTHYEEADVILVGASRCGKTPTSMFLAVQFGVAAANFPITDDDILDMQLPDSIKPFKEKLFGLTIRPERLAKIRQERRPNSRYASLVQCENEVQKIEVLYKRLNIPFADTTTKSVEEISALVLQHIKWDWR